MLLISKLLVIVSCLVFYQPEQIDALRFGSFPGVEYIFNYTDGYQWCNPSFECDIMSYLCYEINNMQPCSLTIFENLEERLTFLEEDKVDIVVSRFNVSPEREKRVDFVAPYYYIAGAQLFTLPEDQDMFTSFDDLRAQFVCMDTGYYVALTLAEQFGLIVFPAIKEAMFDLVQQGFCVAAITDSAFVIAGLVPSNVESIYAVPYAVAISQTPKVPNLANLVQEALLKMHLKKNNESSTLEDLEGKYFISSSVKPRKELSIVSDAITTNKGRYIGKNIEDEIWQAANLTNTRKYSNELLVIDPFLDEKCREGLAEIYNGLANGVAIENLPLHQYARISYTLLWESTPFQTGSNDFIMLRHPILEDNITYDEWSIGDPQADLRLQIYKEGFFDHPEDNTFYYISFPMQREYLSAEFKGQQFVIPTKNIVTALCHTIVGKGIYAGRIFLGNCAVGEISDW